MKKNGYTMVELLVVIIVVGIITTVTLSMTSYAFKDHTNEYYDEKIDKILEQAERYGQNLSNLKKENTLIITANDLIKEGYYLPDDKEGNITNPENSKANLNGLKIKLSYNNGNIKASLIED